MVHIRLVITTCAPLYPEPTVVYLMSKGMLWALFKMFSVSLSLKRSSRISEATVLNLLLLCWWTIIHSLLDEQYLPNSMRIPRMDVRRSKQDLHTSNLDLLRSRLDVHRSNEEDKTIQFPINFQKRTFSKAWTYVHPSQECPYCLIVEEWCQWLAWRSRNSNAAEIYRRGHDT